MLEEKTKMETKNEERLNENIILTFVKSIIKHSENVFDYNYLFVQNIYIFLILNGS